PRQIEASPVIRFIPILFAFIAKSMPAGVFHRLQHSTSFGTLDQKPGALPSCLTHKYCVAYVTI
ncbi:MAG: hypothetical protein ACKOAH_10975, partial [Pirellula sp.]